jgi:flagellin-like hook-associated protein FlgL
MQRITQRMLNQNVLQDIQNRQRDLLLTQRQISTGNRYEKPSEAPRDAAVALNLQQAIGYQQQLRSNAQVAQDFNSAAEVEMRSAESVMQRVRELALRSASEALNEQQLDAISAELDGLLDSMVDSGNGTHEGRFLFGGYQTQQPPFVTEHKLSISGNQLSALGLNSGSFATRIETVSQNPADAGAFALNDGDVIINNVDIGSFFVNDPTRTAEENTQALVERINAKTAETGVSARAVTLPNGTYDTPGAGPLSGIALVNRDAQGNPTESNIEVKGRGFKNTAGQNVLRKETLTLDSVRFRSQPLAAGAIGDVPSGTLQINGTTINSPMTFLAGNSAEQNAQEIARALNTAAQGSGVYAETDGSGQVKLVAQRPFTLSGAPPQLQLPNQTYSPTYDNPPGNAPVSTGGNLTLGSGALVLNGIDIFSPEVTLDASLTAQQRADALVRAVNLKTNDSGISAARDASGQVVFSNNHKQVTQVTYRGDAGDNTAQIGQNSFVPLYLSGDEAFAGHRREVSLVSQQDLPAAGLGSGVSTAPVSFNAGDTLAAGDFVINGTSIIAGPFSGNAATDANSLVTAINAQSGTTQVSAQLEGTNQVRLVSNTGSVFNLQTGGAGTNSQIPTGDYLNAIGAGDFLINGIDIGPIPAVPANPTNPLQARQDLANALASAINNNAALSGVTAKVNTDNAGAVRLQLDTRGQDLSVSTNNPVTGSLLSATGFQNNTQINQKVNVFQSIIDLRSQVLNSKTQRTAVSISNQSVKDISDALDVVIAKQVELGVRVQRAELVFNRSELQSETLTVQLTNNREVDITEAISRLSLEETALQAAYAVTQRLSNLSLLNYI